MTPESERKMNKFTSLMSSPFNVLDSTKVSENNNKLPLLNRVNTTDV